MSQKGFTILELMLVVGMLIVIFSLGFPIAFDFYKNYQLRAEGDKFISLLETTRNSSMINLNQLPHGIYRDNDNFVIFEGNSFAARNQSQDQNFPRAKTISVAGPNEIIFNSLSGQADSSAFVFNNGIKSFNIYVNQEGQINWQ
ncbi:hypothetical protein A3G50_02805 [Candidatus Jorgensenbacteria bacterium RIFCSPLOWO2_12_FULL_42_11]|uniref:General secretion pathway GspH domain-containing protein n=1 Tax=Candidatus Jorgensenbacteria bacterium RIFCSPLOWO2_12_FULL_42_11 TaxID=1798473 RepID=A0A1F6C3X5_9BACT|nr:MAG: hypothetical protein A3G50_02805 [Candidatus Jorgensenbacteria bacterium RIFCSPLOWO2_12_FULL_42_11]